jgi:Dimerisation domain
MTTPLDNVRDISRIAYGFMASKVLFTALDLDLFGWLAAGPKSADGLAADTGLLPTRLEILLTACVGLGLLVKHGRMPTRRPARTTSSAARRATSATTIGSRSIGRSTRRSRSCRRRCGAGARTSIASWTTPRRR